MSRLIINGLVISTVFAYIKTIEQSQISYKSVPANEAEKYLFHHKFDLLSYTKVKRNSISKLNIIPGWRTNNRSGSLWSEKVPSQSPENYRRGHLTELEKIAFTG